jgi:hypothetical protein
LNVKDKYTAVGLNDGEFAAHGAKVDSLAFGWEFDRRERLKGERAGREMEKEERRRV